MGVNISIVDMRTGQDVPGWDWGRFAGDSQVGPILWALPHTSVTRGGPMDEWVCQRPDDIEAFRLALHTALPDNTDRWDCMCDMLAADPNRGLYFVW